MAVSVGLASRAVLQNWARHEGDALNKLHPPLNPLPAPLTAVRHCCLPVPEALRQLLCSSDSCKLLRQCSTGSLVLHMGSADSDGFTGTGDVVLPASAIHNTPRLCSAPCSLACCCVADRRWRLLEGRPRTHLNELCCTQSTRRSTRQGVSPLRRTFTGGRGWGGWVVAHRHGNGCARGVPQAGEIVHIFSEKHRSVPAESRFVSYCT